MSSPTRQEFDAAMQRFRLTLPDVPWSDGIDADLPMWGFDGIACCYPTFTSVTPADANGANFSKVLFNGENWLRHYGLLDANGCRTSAALYSFKNAIFGALAQSLGGIYIAHECFIPQIFNANNDPYCWINFGDCHSTDPNGLNRWHTCPGIMLARDGSMRFRFEWGGASNKINPASEYSSIPFPIGRKFDMELHYVWSDTPTTISVWIDGELALQQSGVITRSPTHTNTEIYMLKLYGSNQGNIPRPVISSWSPEGGVIYNRNVRISGERIWR